MSDNQGATSRLYQGYTVYYTRPDDSGVGDHKSENFRCWYVIIGIIYDSLLTVNHSIVVFFKEKQLCFETLFIVYLFIWRKVYSANIVGIIDYSLLESNRAIVIYLCNG